MCIITEEIIVSEDEEEMQVQEEEEEEDEEVIGLQRVMNMQQIQVQPHTTNVNYATTNNNKRKIPNDHASLISKNIMIETTYEDEDEFDAFGKMVAAKLRRTNKLQNNYAQKIISDTLYNAERNKLCLGSYVCIRPAERSIWKMNNSSPAAVAVVSSAPETGMHTF